MLKIFASSSDIPIHSGWYQSWQGPNQFKQTTYLHTKSSRNHLCTLSSKCNTASLFFHGCLAFLHKWLNCKTITRRRVSIFRIRLWEACRITFSFIWFVCWKVWERFFGLSSKMLILFYYEGLFPSTLGFFGPPLDRLFGLLLEYTVSSLLFA